MKKAIVGILNNPAVSKNSHSAGMVEIVSRLFEADIITHLDDWNNYDELIIYHGTNFRPGSYNIMGGLNGEIFQRAQKLIDYKGKVNSLDGFQLNDFSIKRKIHTFDNFKNIDLINLPERDNIVIGDSHSISVWPNESYTISRNDGKTLHGFLKLNYDLSHYNNIIFYFGNIDLRFHLARQSDPINATKDLFNRYIEYASKYNCIITQLLPVEHESRKIPQSGQYKKSNFFGSKELRKELRNIANEIISNSGLEYIEWPKEYLNEDGDLLFDVMEPKQSVHLRPLFYTRNYKKQLNLFNL